MKNLLVLHILLTFLQSSWELEHHLEHYFAHLLFLHFVLLLLFEHCLFFIHANHCKSTWLVLIFFFLYSFIWKWTVLCKMAKLIYKISLLKCQIFLMPFFLPLFLLGLSLCWVFREVPNNLSFCGHIFHNDYISSKSFTALVKGLFLFICYCFTTFLGFLLIYVYLQRHFFVCPLICFHQLSVLFS